MKILAAIVLALLAAFALAGDSLYPSHTYRVDFPGPPPTSKTITAGSSTIYVNGVAYEWDAELGAYRNATTGDVWRFGPGNQAAFEDWPTPPLAGPPVITVGTSTDIGPC